MHIDQLTKQQLEQEIGKSASHADLANYVRDIKAAQNWTNYGRECMDQLKHIAPVLKISKNELIAELGITLELG